MYKIIIDSCGDLTSRQAKDDHYVSIPLRLEVDEWYTLDDESFDQKLFLEKVDASPNPAKSACPSPEAYYSAMEEAKDKDIYVVTLSSQLSGSYNSAMVARSMFLERYPEANVHVFDSCSASVGETLIGIKIEAFIHKGLPFKDIVTLTNQYIFEQNTFFVLENLDTLRKNGRLSGVKAMIASTLHIKPIMGATPEGTICQLSNARGINKALIKMVDHMLEVTDNTEDKILMIAHCDDKERAVYVTKLLKKKADFKKVYVVDTHGVSSLYANRGGIIMVV